MKRTVINKITKQQSVIFALRFALKMSVPEDQRISENDIKLACHKQDASTKVDLSPDTFSN